MLDLGSVEATQPEDQDYEAAGDTEAEAQAQHQGQLPGIGLKYGVGVNYEIMSLIDNKFYTLMNNGESLTHYERFVKEYCQVSIKEMIDTKFYTI